MTDGFPWLTVIGLIPLLGAVIVALLPAGMDLVAKRVALGFSVVALGFGIAMSAAFKVGRPGFQFQQSYSWISQFGVHYAVGADGIALALIDLVLVLVPVVLLASWHDAEARPGPRSARSFFALMLAMETLLVGVFSATDVFLFYVFFETMLIPMYFLIGSFGGAQRSYAAVKFLLYSLAGGLLMLSAVIGLFVISDDQLGHGTFMLTQLEGLHISHGVQDALFLGFFIAFAIKAPLWPFHTWLPDAGAAAPTGGAVMLVGVLDKVGTFGFIRYCIPLFPDASKTFAPYVIALSLVGILYGALVAMAQRDLRRLVSYTSVAHFGFIALGVFAFTSQAGTGAVLYMVNHGLSTGALFLVVGLLAARKEGSSDIGSFGGVAKPAPLLAGAFLLAGLSSLALPGLNSFVSEFLVLVGTFSRYKVASIVATTGIILAALYILIAYQRTMQGPLKAGLEHIKDLNVREAWVLAPLLSLVIALGIYPKPLLDRITPAVQATYQLAHRGDPAPKHPVQAVRAPGTATSPANTSSTTGGTPVSAASSLQAAVHAASTANPGDITPPSISYVDLSPLIVIFGVALAGVLVEAFVPNRLRRAVQIPLTLAGLLGAFIAVCLLHARQTTVVAGALAVDGPALFLDGTILLLAIGAVLLISERATDSTGGALVADPAALPGTKAADVRFASRDTATEAYPLMVFSVGGMMIFGAANTLLVMFIALEILSLPLYLLAGMARRRRLLSQEAAMKYFLLGAFSSAFFLYGLALVYGFANSVNLTAIHDAVGNTSKSDTFLFLGMGLLAVGLLFKVGAVPFHSWTPDVYQGSPTPVTAFMASGTKVAAFGALLRVFYVAFGTVRWDWRPVMWVVAILTMVVGAVLAITQTDVKRMLAYSSVAHAGFLLVGVTAANTQAVSGTMFYLLTYGFTTIGAFAIVGLVRDGDGEATSLSQWVGLGRRSPFLAGSFAFLLFALAGFPLTSGFTGKFAVFSAAIAGHAVGLVVVAVVTSAVTAFFYARVVVLMFFNEPHENGPTIALPSGFTAAALGLGLAVTLVLGVIPSSVLDLAHHASTFAR